jgi:hypothetical protein
MSDEFWLNEEHWAQLKPLLPSEDDAGDERGDPAAYLAAEFITPL